MNGEKLPWMCPIEHEPPKEKELLLKSPEGIYHIGHYREAYSIFTCQTKSEDMFDWKYIILD
jgi:hypothetical protein